MLQEYGLTWSEIASVIARHSILMGNNQRCVAMEKQTSPYCSMRCIDLNNRN